MGPKYICILFSSGSQTHVASTVFDWSQRPPLELVHLIVSQGPKYCWMHVGGCPVHSIQLTLRTQTISPGYCIVSHKILASVSYSETPWKCLAKCGSGPPTEFHRCSCPGSQCQQAVLHLAATLSVPGKQDMYPGILSELPWAILRPLPASVSSQLKAAGSLTVFPRRFASGFLGLGQCLLVAASLKYSSQDWPGRSKGGSSFLP